MIELGKLLGMYDQADKERGQGLTLNIQLTPGASLAQEQLTVGPLTSTGLREPASTDEQA